MHRMRSIIMLPRTRILAGGLQGHISKCSVRGQRSFLTSTSHLFQTHRPKCGEQVSFFKPNSTRIGFNIGALHALSYQQIRQLSANNKGRNIVSNEDIQFNEVQVLNEHGKLSGPMPRSKALEIAREQGLDLMLVDTRKRPVVCKMVDIQKMLYQQRRKAQSDRLENLHKNQRDKTVKFKSNMAEGDIERQMERIKKFLSGNHNVLVDIWLLRRFNVKHESFANATGIATRIVEMVEVNGIGQVSLRKDKKNKSKYFFPVQNNKINFSIGPTNVDMQKLTESKNRTGNKKKKTKRQKLRLQREQSFEIRSAEWKKSK